MFLHVTNQDAMLEDRWNAIRLVFMNRVWLGVLIVALLAGPASASRALFTGWQTTYTVHLIFVAIAAGGFLLRKKLSFRTRAILLIGLLDMAAIAGVTTFGLLGSAWWWLFIAGLLTSTFYSVRLGLLHTAGAMVLICTVGLAFMNGWRTIPFDANQYVTHYSSWVTMLLGPALLTVFVFWALSTFQDATHALLQEIDSRRAQKALLITQLEQAMAENKTLRGFIPICAHCKKIRDDEGFWENVEAYIQKHADVKFSHGLCPPCGVALYGKLWPEPEAD